VATTDPRTGKIDRTLMGAVDAGRDGLVVLLADARDEPVSRVEVHGILLRHTRDVYYGKRATFRGH
jgi:hypothetical protein